jgi:hypothetical protein
MGNPQQLRHFFTPLIHEFDWSRASVAGAGAISVLFHGIGAIDATIWIQIQGVLDHPAFAGGHIAIMPDCHAGKRAVIEFIKPVYNFTSGND